MDNGIDRMLRNVAEQSVLGSIKDNYRHSRQRMSALQYVATLALATVAATVISLTVVSMVTCTSRQPFVSVDDVCNQITQIFVKQ